ncbi:MAG: FtsX-like permease family protein [Bacteroidales bacterium]
MIIRTAWKNVWRNKIRSLVVISSVTIGIFAGVFAVAVTNGAIEQRIYAALNYELPHIQINQQGFRDNYELRSTLEDTDKMNNKILAIPGVEAVANRVILNAMVSTATKSTGVMVVGIDPPKEKRIFDLHKKIIPGTGSYFEGDRNNVVFIGEDLAKELNIIRYRIESGIIDSLRNKIVPEEVLQKLDPYVGTRFKNQKHFIQTMQSALTEKESLKYGRMIKEEAWSFRERSRLTMTFLDKDNVQTGGMFRIAGIYDIRNNMFEMGRVFVLNSDLQRLTGLHPTDYHQTVVRLKDLDDTGEISDKVRKAFPGLEVLNWKQLQPDLAIITDMVELFYLVFMAIILAALAFGIVNTMLMVVLERTRELGMLTAIGMNKKRVFRMIMVESVFLSIVGGISGMFVSWIIITLTAKNGINFSQYEAGFEAMGFSSHIYPNINVLFFLGVTVLIIITGVLSSIYPALKALRLDPAEALRTE